MGDPEEWADILGEFAEPPKPFVPPLDAELAALEEVVPADKNGPEADEDSDGPPDMDTQFALQAEAMGIDLSGMHAAPAEEMAEHALEEGADEAEGAVSPGTDEEHDEAAAFAGEDITSGLQLADETGAGLEMADIEDAEETGEVPELELANETGEVVQIEDDPQEQPDSSMELDAEGATQQDAGPESGAVDDEERDETPLEFGAVEKAMAELEEQSDVFDKRFFAGADDVDARVDKELEDEELALEDESALDDFALEDQSALDDSALEDDPDGDDLFQENALEDYDLALDEEPQADEPDGDATAGTPHEVPPQSEEEQTLNLLIDQELLSMAVEDKDGFASTIVLGDRNGEQASAEVGEQPAREDTGTGFESIIMEGEFVRSALDQEKRKADIAEAAALAEKANLAREAEAREAEKGSRRGMAAAAILLVVVLVVQVLHQSREALATIPAFNETVGPLYRAIGMPLSPTWDVTGWRFEARRDILDDEADTLTVISRIGNTSAKPLPYPLVNISLTDRFEETIGTKTLDPADYLTDDLDPSKMVRPGNNFTAVMTIKSPSENATGYKLQACYRQPDARLRCHIPTFK